jgi:hypothetical protein
VIDFFVVGEMLRSDRGAEREDGDIRCSWERFDERDADVEGPSEWAGSWEQGTTKITKIAKLGGPWALPFGAAAGCAIGALEELLGIH